MDDADPRLAESTESLRDDALKGRIKDVYMASRRKRKTLKTSSESSDENQTWYHKPKDDGKVH